MKLLRFCCVMLFACGDVVQSTATDAGAPPLDSSAPPDAPSACGDGRKDPGEICFGSPITIIATDVAYDAHFADVDGDGQLDLVYLIGDQLVFHLQGQGQLAATGLDGPTVVATHAISLQLNNTPAAEFAVAGSSADSSIVAAYARTDQATYTSLGSITKTSSCSALAAGKITGSANPEVVTICGGAIDVTRFDAAMTPVLLTGGTAINGGRDLAIAELNGDAFADVIVAGGAGVTFLRGTTGGLGPINNTPQTASTDAVAVGDIDGDHHPDIGFVVKGDTGYLGTMLAASGGGFLAPTQLPIANIDGLLETADLDGDGHADFITVRKESGNNAVLVVLGQANGTLAAPVALPVSITPDFLRADADFNGDGINDIVVTDTHRQMITILPSRP